MESSIALNVRKIIKDKGLKQYAVAEKAGFSHQSFNNMLNGRKLIADFDIPPIANALSVTPNELFGLVENHAS